MIKDEKICVFDLDGTLVNSLYDLADAMNYALVKMVLSHTKEKNIVLWLATEFQL